MIAVAAAAFLSLPSLLIAQQTASTAAVVRASEAFLATLTPDQRQKVIYPFDDATQRARWSNLPTKAFPRGSGSVSLHQMTAPQREAVMKLLATVLSPMGLEKVNEIRLSDDDFKANGSNGRGIFGGDYYYISFLGTPSTTQPWMLQFGGHHLGLNITIAGSKGVLTPTLTGVDPATFTLDGKVIRPLAGESDKALALLQSLDAGQRKQAVLTFQVADLVLGPGEDGKTIVPDGLKASAMNPKQQAMLLDVIGEWSGILTEPYASARMAQMKADMNQTWFAWSGSTSADAATGNISAYYRIQGPHLVIEYAPQSVVQPPPPPPAKITPTSSHVHTIYRDPTNDYGIALVKP